MTTHDEEPIGQIGADLLDHAKREGEPIRLPLITQLFPFLLLASRRMTTREMSSWLAQTKGVKISAPMIVKGLQRPELQLRRIAEFTHPLAAFLAALYRTDVKSLLYGEDPRTGNSGLAELSDEILNCPEEDVSEAVSEAMSMLFEVWEPIPHEVKLMCRPYFEFSNDSETQTNDEP